MLHALDNASVTNDKQPPSFKYYLKANGVRAIIFGGSELKKLSGGVRPVAGQGPGAVFFWIGRFVLHKKHRPILKALGRTSDPFKNCTVAVRTSSGVRPVFVRFL
jgi:hypothetical protein